MIAKEKKQAIINEYGRTPNDTGSPEVQIAVLSARIQELTESINLQKANTVIFYDIPFAIQTFIQMVGRVTRMDSKYDHQDIYFIEAEGTSDTYRRILLQMNGQLINQIFGKVNTLPLEMKFIDKKIGKQLRDSLLWSSWHLLISSIR